MSATVPTSNTLLRFSLFLLKKPKRRPEDTRHALNLLLNSGFEKFHVALTSDGAVHSFEPLAHEGPKIPESRPR